MNKASKRYYGDIRTLLPARGKYEKRFLERIKERITEINDTSPDIDYDSLADILGTPTELITEYYSDIDTDYLIKRLRTSGVIKKVVLCVFVLIFILICVRFFFLYDSYRKCIDSIVIKEENIIYVEED